MFSAMFFFGCVVSTLGTIFYLCCVFFFQDFFSGFAGFVFAYREGSSYGFQGFCGFF